jgi:hypothetical protein
LDQLSKYEKAKIAERTRRGKLRKAREGRVICGATPTYGFRYNGTRDGLLINESEMRVVEKIFDLAADGVAVRAIQARLYTEGIAAPKGGPLWDDRVLRRLIANDVYRPHSFEEIAALVTPEVAARLDPAKNTAYSGSTARRPASTPSQSRTATAGGVTEAQLREAAPEGRMDSRPRTGALAEGPRG